MSEPSSRSTEILAAARGVMSDFGVQRVTVSAVARAAGVSRQTVYEYFPSKDALVQATLRLGAVELIGRGFHAAEAEGGSAQQRLTVLLRTSLQFLRDSLLWSTPGKRADLIPYVSHEQGVYLGAGTDAIEDALAAWWPEVDHTRVRRAADTLARLLVSHGIAPEAGSPTDLAEELSELTARGLR
jgi:AcrR family transcriptional regulator